VSQLLVCPQGHTWWAPFSDGPAPAYPGQSTCPRCGAAVAVPPPAATPAPTPRPPPAAPDPDPGETVTANVGLTISGVPVQFHVTVPTAPVRLAVLLPVFREVTETVVNVAVKAIEAEGQTISCKAGCGACCRQLVPITETEARLLRDMVQALPEPRRSEVLARFAEGLRRLEQGGLLDKLRHPENFSLDELKPIGLDYFHQGVPCPFLEDESCSIHPERPMACREYLVTSPAEHCANPSAETVHCVSLAAKVSNAVSRIGLDPAARFIRWVPLILALDWADRHPDEEAPRPGPEIVTEFFKRLLEKKKEPT
jgi:Fe-S-cluster containining protein